MRLVDVINSCTVKTVTVAPALYLAKALQAMYAAEAEAILVMENDQLQGVLTAADIFRALIMAKTDILDWNGPTATALGKKQPIITSEEGVTKVIAILTTADVEYVPVIVEGTTLVISRCRLLGIQNAFLYDEVQHLQDYIDALHDAPND